MDVSYFYKRIFNVKYYFYDLFIKKDKSIIKEI